MYYSIRYEFIAGAPIESPDASSGHYGRQLGVVTRCNSLPQQARRGGYVIDTGELAAFGNPG